MPLPIVGAVFRPPAKPILESLPVDCPLLLRREPDNPHDIWAVAVWVRTEHIPPSMHPQLATTLPSFGSSLEEVQSSPEWHLGYIPRTLSVEVSSRMDSVGLQEQPGTLTFDPAGKPQIKTSST